MLICWPSVMPRSTASSAIGWPLTTPSGRCSIQPHPILCTCNNPLPSPQLSWPHRKYIEKDLNTRQQNALIGNSNHRPHNYPLTTTTTTTTTTTATNKCTTTITTTTLATTTTTTPTTPILFEYFYSSSNKKQQQKLLLLL